MIKDNALKVKCMLSIEKAIAAIHKRGMAHKNLIPTRVCFAKEDFSIKFVGFENPRNSLMPSTTTFIRSRYSGPEVVHTRAVSQISDLYACGILFWEIWHGTIATSHNLQYHGETDATLMTVINQLTSANEANRGTMQNVILQLSHLKSFI